MNQPLMGRAWRLMDGPTDGRLTIAETALPTMQRGNKSTNRDFEIYASIDSH